MLNIVNKNKRNPLNFYCISYWQEKNSDDGTCQFKELNCSRNQIIQLYKMPSFLISLDCSFNNLRHLDNLPRTLLELNCSFNQISELDNLPNSLIKLTCLQNNIISLDKLPKNMRELNCSHNQIRELCKLPGSLRELNCSHNQIRELNNIPLELSGLKCGDNPIISEDIEYWKSVKRFRKLYYSLKFSSRVEGKFMGFVRRRNLDVNNQLLSEPRYGFYKQFLSEETRMNFNFE